MFVVTKKLDPTKSVVNQLGGFNRNGYQPVHIHQHNGRISKVIQGIITDKLPVSGNYARTTVKL